MNAPHVQDEDLLDPSPAEEQHLRTCAICAERQREQLRVRGLIASLDRSAPVPETARQLFDAARQSGRSRATRAGAALLAASVAAAAIVLAVRGDPLPLPRPIIDELALDHLHYERKADRAEVHGAPDAMADWFAAKLAFRPHYGALEATSFEGGKPCRIAGKWTALVWLERAGHLLSLFTMPEHAAGARGCADAQGVHVCAVPDPAGGARVLVGDLPRDELLRLADESLR